MTRHLRIQRQRRLQQEQSGNGGIVKHPLDRMREQQPDLYRRLMQERINEVGGPEFLQQQLNPDNGRPPFGIWTNR